MENKKYQAWAVTKDRPTYDDVTQKLAEARAARLIHGALGCSGEVGEMVDVIKKHVMYGKELDVEHMKEEIADTLWYVSIILDEVGSSFDEVMQMNHDKLEKRFPSGYSNEAAIARVDKVK